jgi:hypothetical protein
MSTQTAGQLAHKKNLEEIGLRYSSGELDFHAARDESIATMAARITQLEVESAELLAALGGLMQRIGSVRPNDGDWVCKPIHADEINSVIDAIAKVTGSAHA